MLREAHAVCVEGGCHPALSDEIARYRDRVAWPLSKGNWVFLVGGLMLIIGGIAYSERRF